MKDDRAIVIDIDDDEQEERLDTMSMLSTIDNPFNPFDDFMSWFMFDIEKGYNCCAYLARIVNESDDMTEREKNAETERAIDEIITLNPNPIYIKVQKQVNLFE